MGKKGQYVPQDRGYHRAKQAGYASRAAFKLLEVQKKWRILGHGHLVLDLGASPGSWSQYALAEIGPKGAVIGIDLAPIETLANTPNFYFLQGNVQDPNLRPKVSEYLKKLGRPSLDNILSDLSPKLSGIVLKDQVASLELAETALSYAMDFLGPGGNLMIKLFPGQDLPAFRKKMAAQFEDCRLLQLEASRRTSREVYLLGNHFKS